MGEGGGQHERGGLGAEGYNWFFGRPHIMHRFLDDISRFFEGNCFKQFTGKIKYSKLNKRSVIQNILLHIGCK